MRRRGPTRMGEDGGQVLPLVVIFAVVLIGFTGLAIDMARVWVTKQQLQRAVDAAALAAGQELPNSANAYTAAVKYSANGTANPMSGWGVTAGSPSVTFECVSHGPDYTAGSTPTCLTDSSNKNCAPSGATSANGVATCNAVNVTESATVKTGLLSFFYPSFTVKASSTAAARGEGVPNPMNVFIIMDTSGSMGPPNAPSGGPKCTASVTGITSSTDYPSKLDCAKAGVRAMLQALEPCTQEANATDCGTDSNGNYADPVDEVGMLVFPAITGTLTKNSGSTTTYKLGSSVDSTYLSDETDCSSSDTFQDTYPPYTPYTSSPSASNGYGGMPLGDFSTYANPSSDYFIDDFPGYQAVPLSSDYRTSDLSTALNPNSSLVKSVWWYQCNSSHTWPGGDYYGLKDITELANIHEGSYLAGAITEAQYLLDTAELTNPRTGPNDQAVSNAIVILSDGQLDQPTKCASSNNCPSTNNPYFDGVAPGQAGNVGWTDTKPCQDAETAANDAKAQGTLIFSIAYDSSGNCTDSGGGINVSATSLMENLATSSSDYFNSPGAGDLTNVFGEVGTQLTGDSTMIPDCTQAPPGC